MNGPILLHVAYVDSDICSEACPRTTACDSVFLRFIEKKQIREQEWDKGGHKITKSLLTPPLPVLEQ